MAVFGPFTTMTDSIRNCDIRSDRLGGLVEQHNHTCKALVRSNVRAVAMGTRRAAASWALVTVEKKAQDVNSARVSAASGGVGEQHDFIANPHA